MPNPVVQEDLAPTIVLYARHLCGTEPRAATDVDRAQHRGWLDAEGRPTESGRALVEAVHGQRGMANSAFRNL